MFLVGLSNVALSTLRNFYLNDFLFQVRYKLGLSDDEEDEVDASEQPRSDQDLCHPLCQCDKCSKWQKVCHVMEILTLPLFFLNIAFRKKVQSSALNV